MSYAQAIRVSAGRQLETILSTNYTFYFWYKRNRRFLNTAKHCCEKQVDNARRQIESEWSECQHNNNIRNRRKSKKPKMNAKANTHTSTNSDEQTASLEQWRCCCYKIVARSCFISIRLLLACNIDSAAHYYYPWCVVAWSRAQTTHNREQENETHTMRHLCRVVLAPAGFGLAPKK